MSTSRWSARRHTLAGLAVTVMLTGGVGLWATQSQIAGAVIAQGHLRVDTRSKEISHLDGGVVQDILVRDGDQVEAGQVLIRLDPTSVAASLEIVDAQLDEHLALRARLLAENLGHEKLVLDDALAARIAARPEAQARIEGQQAILDAGRTRIERQTSQLREQLRQTEEQIVGYEAQIAALDKQLELVTEELATAQGLHDRGFAPKTKVTELRLREADLMGSRGAIASQAAEAAARGAEIGLRILEVEAERHQVAVQQLREVEAKLNELHEQRIGLAPALQRMEIRAPESGTVLNLQTHTIGGAISPGRPLLSIVPDDEELVVEVRIDAASRDRVWIGQEARVKFPSFNQRITPDIPGQIKTLSADAVEDDRTGMRFYLADLEVDPQALAQIEEINGIRLSPGMLSEVYIHTEDRTAASYFIKPVLDSFNRAFREK